MVDSSAVKAYLTGISRRYERWRQDNALTETIAEGQSAFTFEQFVQTEEKRQGERPEKITLPLYRGIRDYLDKEHILLVGSPGVGKSSALWHCLNALAQEEVEATEPRIPVLVQLKGFTNSDDPFSVRALIRTSIGLRLRLSDTDIEDLLCDKRLILLLDGLNEMGCIPVMQ
jgi:predicted NACHT family NTPase